MLGAMVSGAMSDKNSHGSDDEGNDAKETMDLLADFMQTTTSAQKRHQVDAIMSSTVPMADRNRVGSICDKSYDTLKGGDSMSMVG